jgi:hypothetical protein
VAPSADTLGGPVSSRRSADDEIERRIAERDRLLARAQHTSEHAHDRGRIELTILAEHERMATRMAELEEALRYFADAEWLARASLDEIVAVARGALDGKSVAPAEHWLTRVERIAATA